MSEHSPGESPLTREQAKAFPLPGWNIRCNRCGSYGAIWIPGERPGWGALALCPRHQAQLSAIKARHRAELAAARQVNFEQEPDFMKRRS